MNIAVGSDHAGYDLKKEVVTLAESLGHKCIDCGTDSSASVDYPDFGAKVASLVSEGKVDSGILICGTGIGMSMVANRFRNVRAALCNDLFTAKMSRLHNDANVLAMGGRVIGPGLAAEIVKTWLTTPFEGGRHADRIGKISCLDAGKPE